VELTDLAGPLMVILAAQAIVMTLYAAFVTFRIMGKNYDAAVLAAGHCGFGMGPRPRPWPICRPSPTSTVLRTRPF
jgi:ESS family glutamate:Na+ symporter